MECWRNQGLLTCVLIVICIASCHFKPRLFFPLCTFSFLLIPSLFLYFFHLISLSPSYIYLLLLSPAYLSLFPCTLLVSFNALFNLALRHMRGVYLLRRLGSFHARVLQHGGQKSLGTLKWLRSSSLKCAKPQFGKLEGNPFPQLANNPSNCYKLESSVG